MIKELFIPSEIFTDNHERKLTLSGIHIDEIIPVIMSLTEEVGVPQIDSIDDNAIIRVFERNLSKLVQEDNYELLIRFMLMAHREIVNAETIVQPSRPSFLVIMKNRRLCAGKFRNIHIPHGLAYIKPLGSDYLQLAVWSDKKHLATQHVWIIISQILMKPVPYTNSLNGLVLALSDSECVMLTEHLKTVAHLGVNVSPTKQLAKIECAPITYEKRISFELENLYGTIPHLGSENELSGRLKVGYDFSEDRVVVNILVPDDVVLSTITTENFTDILMVITNGYLAATIIDIGELLIKIASVERSRTEHITSPQLCQEVRNHLVHFSFLDAKENGADVNYMLFKNALAQYYVKRAGYFTHMLSAKYALITNTTNLRPIDEDNLQHALRMACASDTFGAGTNVRKTIDELIPEKFTMAHYKTIMSIIN